MDIVAVDQTQSEVRLNRVLYFIKYLRAMLLNLGLILVALALYAFGIEGVYFLADDTIAALKAQIVQLEAQGELGGKSFVWTTAIFSGAFTLALFLWMYLAITHVWRKSLKIQAVILLASALFAPVWAWPQVQFAFAHLHPAFAALVAGSFLFMILLVLDVAYSLWGVSRSPEASSFTATLDPTLTRGPWSYVNKLLDLPRTPWRSWHNILAYAVAVAGAILLVVALLYLITLGAVNNKLAMLISSCTEANIEACRVQSAAWVPQIALWLVLAFLGLKAGGFLQATGKWLGGLSIPEVLAASGNKFILYLRPFDTDDDVLPKPKLPFMSRLMAFRPFPVRVEEELFDVADGYLPLVAIGRPGEAGQEKGGIAYRAYLEDSEWQAYVADKIANADSIVMLLKSTNGVRWEISKVLNDSVEEKTLFLFEPAAKDPAVWDKLAAEMIAPFIAGGFLPQGFAFEGRPMGFYFRDHQLVEIMNENWSATSYRTAFSEYLSERARAARS